MTAKPHLTINQACRPSDAQEPGAAFTLESKPLSATSHTTWPTVRSGAQIVSTIDSSQPQSGHDFEAYPLLSLTQTEHRGVVADRRQYEVA